MINSPASLAGQQDRSIFPSSGQIIKIAPYDGDEAGKSVAQEKTNAPLPSHRERTSRPTTPSMMEMTRLRLVFPTPLMRPMVGLMRAKEKMLRQQIRIKPGARAIIEFNLHISQFLGCLSQGSAA